MKVVIIIQARMGSTRLPGKVLMDIGGKPAIAHVVERARMAKRGDTVILATTTDPSDDVLAAWAEKNRVPVYRGSEHDVLDRYYQCAKKYAADAVVRLTGDCQLLDPAVVDMVIDAYSDLHSDYVSNAHPPTYPDGLDVEVFSFFSLEKAWNEAKLQSEREHVTPYIWKHPELFRLKNVENSEDLSVERWTLDTPEDVAFLRKVCAHLPPQDFSFATVLRIMSEHREWRDMNAMHARNEGYAKSLAKD